MSRSGNTDECRNYRQFDVGDRSATLAVIESVASFKQTDPLSLPALASHADPEALEQLIATLDDGTVQFEYDGLDVEIAGSGEITVAERVK